ncbi:MAG: ankyrin repeat domain-containing protein [Synergistaceae bacterium]|nr:ankyrin repeat domain-containing protein [Synergistaceae bacterium]
MKKFVCLLMLCVMIFSVPVEVFADDFGKQLLGTVVNVLVNEAAKNSQKNDNNNNVKTSSKNEKTTTKQPRQQVTKLSENQVKEFMRIFLDGNVQKLKEKLERENISPNASGIYDDEMGTHIELPLICGAAYWSPNADTVKFLISLGADVDAKDKDPFDDNFNQDSALHQAAFRNNSEMIKALLDAGAKVDIRNALGETPLMNAVKSAKKEIDDVKLLINSGADVNARAKRDVTVLMVAASDNWGMNYTPNPEIVKLLLDAGADAKAKDIDGKSVTDYARENKKLTKQARQMIEQAAGTSKKNEKATKSTTKKSKKSKSSKKSKKK